jgi:hypothetical protein
LTLSAALALTSVGGAGCASDQGQHWDKARQEREAARQARPSHVQQASYESDDGSTEMTVSGGEGTLNEADVNAALKDHFAEIRECFHLGKRPQHPNGRLLLRFHIDGKGEAQDVEILESTIGNHFIERCIADIGLGVMFEPPAGHQPATFDYPVELRPAHQLTADRRRP